MRGIFFYLFVLYLIYSVVNEILRDRKNIASIPNIEKDIEMLKKKNIELLNKKAKIDPNVLAYREKYENDRQRKIYYANKAKKRFRRY